MGGSALRRRVQTGKVHNKLTSMARASTARLQRPLMQLHKSPSERQPDAKASGRVLTGYRELSKHVENTVKTVRGNAATVVAHSQGEFRARYFYD